MAQPNMIILYVNNPSASANFYTDVLGQAPIETSSNFVLFVLESGMMLGLWSKQGVEPSAHITGGGTELAFKVNDNAAVDATHAQWCEHNRAVAQVPTQMDFGYTFVGLDPDGHRLRIFSPSESA